MTEIDNAVAAYLDCKRRLAAVKDEMAGHEQRLMDLTIDAGGSHVTESGVKVKYTPPTVNERFDWKGFLKAHPEARVGYMVESPRKETLRVTVPRGEDLDEFGWEV